MTKTAVVILNYNGENFLSQFLPSVVEFSPEAEVIVADNGSTDASLSLLASKFPAVRIIKLDTNYGFCGGYNRALLKVEADYFVLLNSDVEVTPDWLSPLIRALDTDPAIKAVQPKILSYRERHKFEYAGAAGGYIDSLGYPFCRGRVFDHAETDNGQYNDQRDIFWATGACFMIRSETWLQWGGLDEDFFAHMEEIDLCWKILRSGGRISYCGASTVYHVGAGTLAHDSPRKTYLNFRNGLVLIYKHFDPAELYTKVPLRLALDWLAAFTFLIAGRFGHAGAVLKAHSSFWSGLPKNRQKRRAIRSSYPEYPRTVIRSGLIIVDYYLKGKKTLDVQ